MPEQLRTMLRFDWETVNGRPVAAVIGQSAKALSDGAGQWESVASVLESGAVIITVNFDTDELWVDLAPKPGEDGTWSAIEAFDSYRGKNLGWCWEGRNYRGYLDSLAVSFDGIDPQFMLIGLGSAIVIKTLEDVLIR